jgi:hypothetical protein
MPTGEIDTPGANWRVVPRPRRRRQTPPPTPIPLRARRRALIPLPPPIPEIPLHRHLPTPPGPPTGDLAPQGFPGPHPRARVAILGSNALGGTAEGYTVPQMYEDSNPWGQGQRRRG